MLLRHTRDFSFTDCSPEDCRVLWSCQHSHLATRSFSSRVERATNCIQLALGYKAQDNVRRTHKCQSNSLFIVWPFMAACTLTLRSLRQISLRSAERALEPWDGARGELRFVAARYELNKYFSNAKTAQRWLFFSYVSAPTTASDSESKQLIFLIQFCDHKSADCDVVSWLTLSPGLLFPHLIIQASVLLFEGEKKGGPIQAVQRRTCCWM